MDCKSSIGIGTANHSGIDSYWSVLQNGGTHSQVSAIEAVTLAFPGCQ